MLERNFRKKKQGIVVSNRADKTITVRIDRRVRHPLYGKFVRKCTKLMGHDAQNVCSIGDEVLLMETRPLSKRKRWRLLKVINKARSA